MKLATYRSDSNARDGELMVVARDLSTCVSAQSIAPTLQAALDDWSALSDRLSGLYQQLNSGSAANVQPFDSRRCLAPLPRAFQWADGSAYVNHVELVRRARGAQMPDSFWSEPLMYQGGSDDFIGAVQDVPLPSDEWGVDFEGEVAVITDDVPMGASAETAASRIRLVTLVNDVSLRGLIPGELEKGFGFFQSKPASAFAPVAVTPDELGTHWRDSRVHLPLRTHYNGELFGYPDAGDDMTFSFAQLIAHAARTRNLGAGAVIGSGTVSSKQGTDYGTSVGEGGRGYSCIAELRMIETIRDGQPTTPFMRFGDRVRMEMLDADGASIFGAIDQQMVAAG
ncbi:MAG: fumarylacetoacetate hydrolase family protein [Pseudomonadaceae bacterium]|nr:fumarylacetoacetate hydrolase family protein [Pseudomonadaceae bacterium]